MASDDHKPDEPELLEPDAEQTPPPRAERSRRRRDDDYDDDYDDRDDRFRSRRRGHVKYDEEGNEITSEDTTWGLFSHLGMILFGFLAPLILLLVFRHKSPFVVRHSKAALNCSITHVVIVFAWMAVSALIGFVLYLATQEPIAGFVTGYILTIVGSLAAGIAMLVFAIMGTVAAANAREYRYPMCIKFVG